MTNLWVLGTHVRESQKNLKPSNKSTHTELHYAKTIGELQWYLSGDIFESLPDIADLKVSVSIILRKYYQGQGDWSGSSKIPFTTTNAELIWI